MSRALRVLLIEDSNDDVTLILRQLKQGGFSPQSWRAETEAELRAILTTQRLDIILCDYSLPELSAPQAFSILREMKQDTPFIIVSGTIGEERAVECMRSGVSDFVLKDRLARLPHAVDRELADAAQRAEQVRMREQLLRAEEALRRSEKLRALGQMAAGIAHDLKNLLHPLHMRLQLLERQVRKNAPDAAQANIEQMRSILQTGVQTIERLQQFSRQSPEANAAALDLNIVGHNALEIARPRMAQNRGTPCFLREEFGAPPFIQGNASELISALVNLIGNAIDAMPGGGTISLRTGQERGGAFIQVADDGPGMAKEVEQRVFEPFFTTKGEAGMGLGLAMVYSTVLRHEGTISLATEVGKGTTFTLWFPRARAGDGVA